MKRTEALERTLKIVNDQMGRDSANEKTHVINDFNADSLDTIEMLMWLEDEFMISITDEEAEKILVVSDAVDLVMLKRQEKETL